MSDFPEITTEQIVARLRMIVAEPDSLCKTDLHYIEDAADELESKGHDIARLTAERDDAREQAERWEDDALRLMTERNKAEDERDKAEDERDRARREVCYASTDPPHEHAENRGWDCFDRKDFCDKL